MCPPALRRKIDACPRELARAGRSSQKGEQHESIRIRRNAAGRLPVAAIRDRSPRRSWRGCSTGRLSIRSVSDRRERRLANYFIGHLNYPGRNEHD